MRYLQLTRIMIKYILPKGCPLTNTSQQSGLNFHSLLRNGAAFEQPTLLHRVVSREYLLSFMISCTIKIKMTVDIS